MNEIISDEQIYEELQKLDKDLINMKIINLLADIKKHNKEIDRLVQLLEKELSEQER